MDVKLSMHGRYMHSEYQRCKEVKYTPLIQAVMDQNIEMVNLLISSKNIDINSYSLYCMRDIDYSEKNNVVCKF